MDDSTEDAPAGHSTDGHIASAKPAWWQLLAPIVVAMLIVFCSPNFQLAPAGTDGLPAVRDAPLGGDFVQEYVGGSIYASPQRDRLYDFEHFNQLEHDPDLTGFRWPAEDYFPMVYPPFYYAAMSGWSLLSYPTAMTAWAILIGAAVSLAGWLLAALYPPCRRNIGLLLVGSILFVPIINNVTMGQKGNFLLLILAATFGLLHRRHNLAAGLAFGLIAFKPHLGLVIGLSMLLQRRWWFVAGALTTVTLMVGLSWWTTPELWDDYLGVVRGMNNYVQTGGYQLHDSHSLWGAMQLTFGGLGTTAVKAITLSLGLLVGGLLVYTIIRPGPTSSTRFAWQFSAMTVATVMLSPHFHGYDLAILGLPIVVFASTAGQLLAPVRKPMLYLILGLVALAGMFAPLAASTGFQFSLILMSAWLVLLSWQVNDSETSRRS